MQEVWQKKKMESHVNYTADFMENYWFPGAIGRGKTRRNKNSTGYGSSYLYAQQLESWGRRITTSSNQSGLHSETLRQKAWQKQTSKGTLTLIPVLWHPCLGRDWLQPESVHSMLTVPVLSTIKTNSPALPLSPWRKVMWDFRIPPIHEYAYKMIWKCTYDS